MPDRSRTNERLEADLQLVERALGHDWREPLQVIRLFTHLQERTGLSTAEKVLQAVELMSVRFTRMSLYLRTWPTSGTCRFREVWDRMRPDATFTGEDLPIDLPAEVLTEVLRELLDNAAHHGTPPVVVDLFRTDRGPMLTVSDGGTGLPQGFDPFAPMTTRDPNRFAGMGLALVRRCVETSGGTVAAGHAGSGTRIAVLIQDSEPERNSIADEI